VVFVLVAAVGLTGVTFPDPCNSVVAFGAAVASVVGFKLALVVGTFVDFVDFFGVIGTVGPDAVYPFNSFVRAGPSFDVKLICNFS